MVYVHSIGGLGGRLGALGGASHHNPRGFVGPSGARGRASQSEGGGGIRFSGHHKSCGADGAAAAGPVQLLMWALGAFMVSLPANAVLVRRTTLLAPDALPQPKRWHAGGLDRVASSLCCAGARTSCLLLKRLRRLFDLARLLCPPACWRRCSCCSCWCCWCCRRCRRCFRAVGVGGVVVGLDLVSPWFSAFHAPTALPSRLPHQRVGAPPPQVSRVPVGSLSNVAAFTGPHQ